MGQSVPELPADTLVSAVDNARRGVVTHITIKGERVAPIVAESPERAARVLVDWQAVAEVRAGARST